MATGQQLTPEDQAELQRLRANQQKHDERVAQLRGSRSHSREDAQAYAALAPIDRARLKQSDLPRFERLQAAHQARLLELDRELAAAKTFAERSRVLGEIDKLTGAEPEGPSAA